MPIRWNLTAVIGEKGAHKEYPSWADASAAIETITSMLPKNDRDQVCLSVKSGPQKGLHSWVARGGNWRLSVSRMPDNDMFDPSSGGPLLMEDHTCPSN